MTLSSFIKKVRESAKKEKEIKGESHTTNKKESKSCGNA
jgi:hypothetical protein